MNAGFASPTSGSMVSGKGSVWQVLIVSDNLIDRKLAVGLLSKQGHQVTFAEDHTRAQQACEKARPDLVIVDFFSPELNPRELVRVIRQMESAAGMRSVILAVATDADEVATQYRDLGMDGFLIKPLNIDQVNMWMERSIRPTEPAKACGSSTDPPLVAIDWTDALEAVGGRRELLKDLIEIFYEEYPPTMTSIREAVDQQNIRQLQLSAHKLKGCLRYFGQSMACDKAQDLEYLARSGTLSGAAGHLVELESAMATFIPMLKSAPIATS